MENEYNQRSLHQRRVDRFMREAKQEVPTRPTAPPTAIRILRAKLILEEALETVQALGCMLSAVDGGLTVADSPTHLFDMVKVVDGCFDLRVVTTGTLSAIGIPDEFGQEIVDQANLSKFEPPDCPECQRPMQFGYHFAHTNGEPEWACTHCTTTFPKEAGPYQRKDGKWVKPPYFTSPEGKLDNWIAILSKLPTSSS